MKVIIRHVSHFRKHGEVICACDMYLNIHDSGSDGTDEYPVDHDSRAVPHRNKGYGAGPDDLFGSRHHVCCSQGNIVFNKLCIGRGGFLNVSSCWNIKKILLRGFYYLQGCIKRDSVTLLRNILLL